jgi:putative endonuclease
MATLLFFMHYVYIIYTFQFDRFYIGETVNFEERIKQHNQGHYGGASTKFANDWQKSLVLTVENRRQALLVESYIKKMKSKQYLKRISSDEESYNIFKSNISNKFNIQVERLS